MQMNKIKGLCVFLSGAFAYGVCELLFRGRTHITMGLLGGLTMLFMHYLNDKRRMGRSVLLSAAMGALFITVCEYIAGLILNVTLHLDVWDYSDVSFNYRGQICLKYSLRWVLISVAGMLLDELLRRFVFRADIYFLNLGRIKDLLPVRNSKGAKANE